MTFSLTVFVILVKEMLLMVAVPSYFFKVYSVSVGMAGGSLSQIISEKNSFHKVDSKQLLKGSAPYDG